MSQTYWSPFRPINSTNPSFSSSSGSSSLYAIESTTLGRVFGSGSGRSLRIASTGANFYLAFGSSTIVANSTDGMQFLGNTVEVQALQPSWSYLMLKSSTDVVVNFTLGYGQ